MNEDTTSMGDTTEEDENPIMPEGVYRAQIIKVDPKKKTANGDDLYHVHFQVINGEWTGQRLWANQMVYYKGSPSIRGQGFTRHFLHQINQDYQGTLQVDTEVWVGQIVDVTVGHKEYKGQTQLEITDYKGLGDPDQKPTQKGAGTYEEYGTAGNVLSGNNEEEVPF